MLNYIQRKCENRLYQYIVRVNSGHDILRPFAALGSLPVDVLSWGFDITRFAVDTAIMYVSAQLYSHRLPPLRHREVA